MKLNTSGFSEALAKIGKIKEVVSTEAGSPLEKLVLKLGQDIIDKLKASGVASGMSPNSLLIASIGAGDFISVNGNKMNITISANEYWDFVNSGVNGTVRGVGGKYNFKTPYPNKKMAASLKNGMASKGLSLPPGFKDYDSYSYAAATNIKKYGIKPNHFADFITSKAFIEKISLNLAQQLGREIVLKIKVN